MLECLYIFLTLLAYRQSKKGGPMKDFIDKYGDLLLDIAGTAVILGILIALIYKSGYLQNFMQMTLMKAC